MMDSFCLHKKTSDHSRAIKVWTAGQKGSDVSAREATKKLVAATKQMHALQAVLQDVHASVSSSDATSGGLDGRSQHADECLRSAAAEAGPWAAKNTIVRDVLNELTNAAQTSRARLRYKAEQTLSGHKAYSQLASPVKHSL